MTPTRLVCLFQMSEWFSLPPPVVVSRTTNHKPIILILDNLEEFHHLFPGRNIASVSQSETPMMFVIAGTGGSPGGHPAVVNSQNAFHQLYLYALQVRTIA